jgi:hypothetical protein
MAAHDVAATDSPAQKLTDIYERYVNLRGDTSGWIPKARPAGRFFLHGVCEFIYAQQKEIRFCSLSVRQPHSQIPQF